jgi:hypothetical protein
MNKKNLLVIGVVVLVAFGVWFYFDSREDVGMQAVVSGPDLAMCFSYMDCIEKAKEKRENARIGARARFEQCINNGGDPLECVEQMIADFRLYDIQYETRVKLCYQKYYPLESAISDFCDKYFPWF